MTDTSHIRIGQIYQACAPGQTDRIIRIHSFQGLTRVHVTNLDGTRPRTISKITLFVSAVTKSGRRRSTGYHLIDDTIEEATARQEALQRLGHEPTTAPDEEPQA